MKKILLLLLFVCSISNAQTINAYFNEQISGGTLQVEVYFYLNSGESGTVGATDVDFTFNNSALDFIDGTKVGDFSDAGGNIEQNGNTVTIAYIYFNNEPTIGDTPEIVCQLDFSIVNDAQSSNLIWTKSEVSAEFGDTLYTVGNWQNSDEPLPVELMEFDITNQEEGFQINWATATEVNNYGFDVERKDLEKDSWVNIGFVEGAGNSNSPKNYSYFDNYPEGGTEFLYRLKQLDYDGTFQYSDTLSAKIEFLDDFVSQNFPNPFNPSTTIKYSLKTDSKVKLDVFNVLGEKVVTLVDSKQKAGFHKVNFNAAQYASGYYIYRFRIDDKTFVKKMLLLK